MIPLRGEGAPLVLLLAGFVLWSIAFLALYFVQATGCSLGWQALEVAGPVTLQRLVLVAMFLGFLVAHLVLYRLLLARPAESGGTSAFSRDAGRTLALAAFGASVFCFSGVLWLTAC